MQRNQSNTSKSLVYELICLIAFGLASLTPGSGNADESPSVRPNIVFLMADDQCTYSLGCYGTPGVKTPNLDQLAREGMIFNRHYATTAICMASRVSVMTGLLEYRTGCNFGTGHLVRDLWEQSYPVLLRKSGYRVAFAGKFGFMIADAPESEGTLPVSDFDRWGGGPGQTHYETRKNESMAAYAEEYPHATLAYGAFGSDFIRDSAQEGRPFCLSISFKAPHRPVQPDPRFDGIYDGVQFVKPKNFGREKGSHFSRQSRQGRQYSRFESWGYRSDYQQVMSRYYQQIYAIDFAVGMIRDALRQANVAENTVIIYTSDNGFLCGSHGYGSKVLPYEEASRVPLIVLDPRRRRTRRPSGGQQRRCNALTGNIDVAPTILDLAGIDHPDNPDGRSLCPLLDDPGSEIHKALPLINVWGPKEVHSLAVVTADFKYVYWPYASGDYSPSEELYDMRLDRLEMVNLIERPSVIAQTSASDLEWEAREAYRDILEDWKLRSVSFHGYPRFAVIFDPARTWAEKADLYQPQ